MSTELRQPFCQVAAATVAAATVAAATVVTALLTGMFLIGISIICRKSKTKFIHIVNII